MVHSILAVWLAIILAKSLQALIEKEFCVQVTTKWTKASMLLDLSMSTQLAGKLSQVLLLAELIQLRFILQTKKAICQAQTSRLDLFMKIKGKFQIATLI